jgi:ABC-type amino acid transport substrate-binding protein
MGKNSKKLMWGMVGWCIAFPLLGAKAVESPPAASLTFGYSKDGSPVSSVYNSIDVVGFCQAVQGYLNKKGYQLDVQELDVNKRFENFASDLKGKAGIQCGPSSQTYERQQKVNRVENTTSEFTQVFFTTTTKILIRKDKIDALYNPTLGGVKIGVIKGKSTKPDEPALASVTSSSIKGLFPLAEFIPLEHKADAIARLEAGTIDAFASDALLLVDIQNHNLQHGGVGYSIEPPMGVLPESYVLVTYNAKGLASELNDWLKNSEDAQEAKATLESLDENNQFSKILTAGFTWLNRSDHLETAKWGVILTVFLGMLVFWGCLALFLLHFKKKIIQQTIISEQKNLKTITDEFHKSEQDKRKKFSSELHNNIQQLLTSAKWAVETGLKQLSKQDTAHQESFKSAISMLSDSTKAVRDLYQW